MAVPGSQTVQSDSQTHQADSQTHQTDSQTDQADFLFPAAEAGTGCHVVVSGARCHGVYADGGSRGVCFLVVLVLSGRRLEPEGG